LPYIENLSALQRILTQAGFEVQFGSLTASKGTPEILIPENGTQITKQPLILEAGRLCADTGFVPDVVLMNNDGTAGIPDVLKNIEQPVLPSLQYGWFQRRKSCHFKAYAEISAQFAEQFGLDPWLISAYFDSARGIDFKHRTGVDALARKVDALVEKSKIKHAEYGITDAPYVYVKADSGTYGMGIMMVHDGSELLEMNKKQRNKMHVIKDGAEVHDVILQEGVKTIDSVDGKPAEPMVYLVDGVPVGGMFRANSARDAYGNLNAAGMEYIGMCDENEAMKNAHRVAGCDFSAYGMIGAIAAIAAGMEDYNESIQRKQSCG
jgi:glutamate--cysteine ligase